MKYIFLAFLGGFIFSQASSQSLTEEAAIRLARLPLHCINTEFPNKTSHTADEITDAVLLPHQLRIVRQIYVLFLLCFVIGVDE